MPNRYGVESRYKIQMNVRFDIIVERAFERLAEAWGLKGQRGYKSSVVRMAIVYAYLVDILKLNPEEARKIAHIYPYTELQSY